MKTVLKRLELLAAGPGTVPGLMGYNYSWEHLAD